MRLLFGARVGLACPATGDTRDDSVDATVAAGAAILRSSADGIDAWLLAQHQRLIASLTPQAGPQR